MKESFGQLYARLYRENFEELENLRQKTKKVTVSFIMAIIITFIFASFNPIFIFIAIFGAIICISVNNKNNKNVYMATGNKSYHQVFKEKIVGPIIENVFDGAKYNMNQGLSELEYRKAGYKDYYDRYRSEDLIIAPLNVNKETATFITFAEVHTERESRDSDGDRTYTTVFHGLSGSFLIPKDTKSSIYIRANGRVSSWNKNKVKMDMSEFEKIFDVESEDAILAMRMLTADVMTEMIDLYTKYKYRFEINIIGDTVYMRLRTGGMFEPNIFGSSMEYKTIEKYYIVLKALTNIASHIYDTVSKLEI